MKRYIYILKGLFILLLMLVYWLLIGFVTDSVADFYSNNYKTIFYGSILVSLLMYFGLVFFYYKRSQVKSLKNILSLSLPFLLFSSFLQCLEFNPPRLLDIGMAIVGIFLIYIMELKQRKTFAQVISLVFYFLVVVIVYPFAYENIWYAANKAKTQSNQLGKYDLKIKSRTGKEFNLSDLKGKTVVVDMWASSCGNCIATMPEFEKLNKQFKSDSTYEIISLYCPIDTVQTYDWFKKYIDRKFSYDIEYYYIDYENFNKLGIRQFPEFLMINKTSKLVYRGQISYETYVYDNIYRKLKSVHETD